MDDEPHKIRIFASDDNLKSLGELLSNETSRKIITHLMNNTMYTNEIATKLDIRVSLVIHHLKKLQELGLVEITNKKIKRRGEEHRFFKMSSDIFITLDKNKKDIEEEGILKRIFKEGIKFVGIGFFGLIPFTLHRIMFTQYSSNADSDVDFISSDSIILGLILVIIGLIIERTLLYMKKK